MFDYVIGIFAIFIHKIIIILNILIPLLSNDNTILYFAILFNVFLVIQWMVIKKCIITYIENYFYFKSDVELDYSYDLFSGAVCLFNVSLCLYKILNNCN